MIQVYELTILTGTFPFHCLGNVHSYKDRLNRIQNGIEALRTPRLVANIV